MLRAEVDRMRRPRSVLFLCTGNSARSILAEALLEQEGEGGFRAFSAGSRPKGQVHPMALALLDDLGFETDRFRSKSWDEFAAPGAPQIDLIVTVCGNAAGETCPVWPGRPATAHWGVDDPAAVEGPGQRAAFEAALSYLRDRIRAFVALPFDALDEPTLRARLNEIGSMPGREGQSG